MNKNSCKFLVGSVCLERNRWGSRKPSFAVSEWLPRIQADGVDGVELWQYHYTEADDAERARLEQNAALLPIYNTYIGFGDADEEARADAASIAKRLGAKGVKYNIGNNPELLQEYRRNVVAWASMLPSSCRLLCECHPGTLLEDPTDAAAFFEGLDAERFGVLIHVGNATTESVKRWFDEHRSRIQHLHVQLRSDELDPATPAGRSVLAAGLEVAKGHGFSGSVTLEFTRGMGREENIETLYANALADIECCREILSC